ncbi:MULTISPECIES: hypothetical protein [Pseudonocardia]|uniref:Lipoprotein n=2 Tax=Pseudonocardia TaxID=1847 RepID=A0A1Y2MXT7_PSEAH|nr:MULTISPECIES: hypothetical protein [Pseudonocardia]OSY39458.1 hypothetical protein BG845_03403 [Pseudonocardia autotrophica]TDN75304.1 hypothetical protein C8E95_4454 [Pseudonocardia autotrophica]BBF99250.1 hypothetical protein Pdca_04600 [Pseudonocardia autotrophica]GEC24796.1 hypothetical protein PSA01_18250 [Pseudonocardia saturnea]
MRAGAVPGAVLAVALLAGCGAAGPGPQEWTDRMCSAVLPFMQTAVEGPAAGDPQQAVGDYLGRTTEALDRTLGDLDRLGPAPVDGGDALAANLQGGLGEMRSAFSGAKARVDALDPADPAAVERDLPGALEPLAQLGSTAGPLDQVTGNPEIAVTFRASAACGELTRLSEAARTAAPDGPAVIDPNGSSEEGGGG